LREFLNYETNEYKLLQIVIFAQKEFSGILARNQGFADRINLKYGLGPLNFKDTRAMVLFRVEQAMEQGKEIPVRFTRRAMREIYRVTGGYPRKIVKLCHQILLALIIQNRKRVDRLLVRSIAQRDTDNRTVSGISWAKAVVLTGLIVILILLVFEKGYFVNNILEEKIVASFATKRGAIRPSADKTAVPIPMESRGEQDMQQDSGKEEITTPLYGASKMPERNKPTKDTGTPSGEGRSPVDVVWKMASKKTATSPSSAPTTDGSIGYPAILGQVRVTQDTVIWHVVRDIYGVCDVRMLHRVAEVNPHINNLDKIVEGDIINFPTIPALHSATPQKNRYLIEIVNTANLEEAVGLYRYYRHEMQKVKMLPYWNDEEGLRFSVVLKRSFAEEHAARQKLIELPPDVAAQGNIIGGWKAGTVFFAGL
jgi:general secretion pathway protein A